LDEQRARELLRQQCEAREAEKMREEQEEWERDIRKRFADERRQREQRQKQEMAEQAERQAECKAGQGQQSERMREDTERVQQESARKEQQNREREREREVWRKRLEKEAERHRAAAAAQAEAEAERLKRNMAEAEAERRKRNMAPPPSPRPSPPGRARRFFRPEDPDAFSQAGAGAYQNRFGGAPSSGHRSASVPKAGQADGYFQARAGPSERRSGAPSSERRSSSVPSASPPSRPSGVENLQQAERSAMQQLRALQQLPSKAERQRAFKDLLRVWHPDKNPQNVEVATAVFQRLQSERSKLLL